MVLMDCNPAENPDRILAFARDLLARDGRPPGWAAAGLLRDRGLESHAWVIEDGGRWLAAALLSRQTPGRAILELGVMPENRRSGLGLQLLEAAASRARAWEVRQLLLRFDKTDAGSAAFADGLGFLPAGMMWRLVAAPGTKPPQAGFKEHVYLRDFRAYNHVPTLTALLVRAYEDRFNRPEYETGAVTADRVSADIARNCDDAFYLVLNAIGKGIAVMRTRAAGELDAPGVVREERSGNLHLALLAHAMHNQTKTADAPIALTAPDEDEARLADYERAGFEVESIRVTYARNL